MSKSAAMFSHGGLCLGSSAWGQGREATGVQ